MVLQTAPMAKTWLVTGCSRGLGKAIARAVLAAGDRLVATARDVRELAELGPSDRLRTVALDVTDGEAVRAAIALATSAFGRLDVVVNNAGYAKANAVEDLSEQEFRRQIDINFYGVYNVSRAALPAMHAQRAGHIIQVSSIGSRTSTPGLAAYQAAKWAVAGFSQALAKEVAPLGIRVTCVEPGGMRTDMFGLTMLEQVAPDYQPTVDATIRAVFGDPAHATNDPDKVAQLILQVAALPEPPVRLLVGADAFKAATAAAAARSAEDLRWEELSSSTGYART